MKTTPLLLVLIVLLFISTSHSSVKFTSEESSYIKQNKIKVAILPDFPPFSRYKNGKLSGYSYDILQLISQKSGLQFEYEIDSWPNNLKKFKEKKVDIIDAISFKKQRLEFTNYTKPYYEVPLVIFSRKDLNNYISLESLKGKKIGITKGIFYKEAIEDLKLFEIVEYDSFQKKLKALAFGEVDIIFGHLLSTQIAINNSGYTNMKVLDELNLPSLSKTDLRFGITKENEILYSIIQKTFDSITIEEWKSFYDKWISIYIKPNEYSKYDIELTNKEKEFIKNKTFKCVQTDVWAPFNFIQNGKRVGISYDFWNLITDKISLKYDCITVAPFSSTLQLIKEKKADITISTTVTEDKKSYAKFTEPYISFPIAIATSLDKSFISSTEALNHKKVAVGKSYSAYKILKKKYPKIDFIEVENDIEALNLLSKGEVFAVVDILPVLSYMIGEYGFKNLKIAGITELTFDVQIMVRDDYEELVPIINKGIKSLSEYEKQLIRNKWLSVKFENVVDYTKYWEIAFVLILIILILFYRQYILNKHNRKLQEAKDEIEIKTLQLEKKTIELNKLTNTLEERVQEEIKKNEEKTKQLMQQSRLAQMGEMISMIAHQWRQPLAAISATTNNLLLKMMIEDKVNKNEFNKEINLIANYSQHLSMTIDDFRNFFKKDKEKIDITVEQIIHNSVSIVINSFKSKMVEVNNDFQANQVVNLYASELSQVILNILTNAQDAFTERDIENRKINIKTYLENSSVIIEIEDNAGGIDKTIIDKVFDPYFSTKGNKEGTGIGLYMSKTIINDHCRGNLSVFNNSVGGATFKVKLPLK